MSHHRKALSLALGTLLLSPAPAHATDAECDRECLDGALAGLVEALREGDAGAAGLSSAAELRENGDIVRFGETMWGDVATVHSSMSFADPLTGNAIVRSGVELSDGTPAYLSTRMRRAPNGEVVAVEIASDRSPMVQTAYVWDLDPIYSTPVPEAERTPRVRMEAIVRRYFNSLDTHVATPGDIDDARCNRFHSGTQITNVAMPGLEEEGAMLTCLSALESPAPWGPASEQRVPVIDEEHGVAVGITLLHYLTEEGSPVMYVTEVFKIIDGQIVAIDNIGLKGEHRDTLGFVD